jgi:hypothetical protein
MIDESIKIAFKNNNMNLNFDGLLEFMESTGISYHNRKINGPMGIATYYCIYIDFNMIINRWGYNLLYFIILHETAHFKRIERMGGKDAVIKMLSIEDFEAFCEHVIGEEIFADRYACFVYQILNNETFPREATQKLHIKEVQERYKNTSAIRLFGVVKNSEEIYKQLVNSFLI